MHQEHWQCYRWCVKALRDLHWPSYVTYERRACLHFQLIYWFASVVPDGTARTHHEPGVLQQLVNSAEKARRRWQKLAWCPGSKAPHQDRESIFYTSPLAYYHIHFYRQLTPSKSVLIKHRKVQKQKNWDWWTATRAACSLHKVRAHNQYF